MYVATATIATSNVVSCYVEHGSVVTPNDANANVARVIVISGYVATANVATANVTTANVATDVDKKP